MATVVTSIPGGKGARFIVNRSSALGQRAVITVRVPGGTVLTTYDAKAIKGKPVTFETAPHPETRRVEVTGYYHYFERGYKESPEGKVLSTENGGDITTIGFDDNGRDDDGQRDYDFNDCTVTVELT